MKAFASSRGARRSVSDGGREGEGAARQGLVNSASYLITPGQFLSASAMLPEMSRAQRLWMFLS